MIACCMLLHNLFHIQGDNIFFRCLSQLRYFEVVSLREKTKQKLSVFTSMLATISQMLIFSNCLHLQLPRVLSLPFVCVRNFLASLTLTYKIAYENYSRVLLLVGLIYIYSFFSCGNYQNINRHLLSHSTQRKAKS